MLKFNFFIFAFLLVMICMIFNSQAQTLPAIETPVAENGQINASETLLLNSSIGLSAFQASFVLRWMNASSELEMALISPSGLIINQSAEPSIIYKSEEKMETYIVADPEPGNWSARITAMSAPTEGEKYTFLTIKILGERSMPDKETEQAVDLNSSDEAASSK
jgi:hypothetical protein